MPNYTAQMLIRELLDYDDNTPIYLQNEEGRVCQLTVVKRDDTIEHDADVVVLE